MNIHAFRDSQALGTEDMVFATRLFLFFFFFFHQEKRHLSPTRAVKEFLGSFMTEFPFENTFDQLLTRYTVSSGQAVWEESEVVLQEFDICPMLVTLCADSIPLHRIRTDNQQGKHGRM